MRMVLVWDRAHISLCISKRAALSAAASTSCCRGRVVLAVGVAGSGSVTFGAVASEPSRAVSEGFVQ